MTIIGILVSILGVYIVGNFTGYFVHWLMHKGKLKSVGEAHNTHHELYTIDDFTSTEYRSAGKDDSAFVFVPMIMLALAILFVPLYFIFNTFWIFPLPILLGIIIGWLNGYMHECFHMEDHYLLRFKWFRKLKHLHWLHHLYPDKNMGIIWFVPDRLFNSFMKEQNEKSIQTVNDTSH